jgi:hypothetical protein
MSAYVAFVVAALALLSLRGSAETAAYIAVGLTAFAAVLDLTYLVRRRGRRCLVLAHRRKLDTVVRVQWLCLLVGGIVVSQGLDMAELAPFVDDTVAVKAPIVAVVIGTSTIYASSLVDWYWVLPNISGIVAPPPCTTLVAKSHAGVTKIWFFHRATATTVITFLIAATPAYIAGTIDDSGSVRAALTLLGTAAAIGFNAATAGTIWAFRQFLSPRVEVGNYVRRRKDIDEPQPQDAYALDVSVQGIKVKMESDVDGQFIRDGDLIPHTEADRLTKSARTDPMCPSLAECQAVNWYCLRNRNAHGLLAPAQRKPAPLPDKADGL